MLPLKLLITRPFVRTLSLTVPQLKRDASGIKRRMKLIQANPDELDNLDVEDLESDFMNVDKSHRELVAEEHARKEKIQSYIVKRKYFKEEKLPNFLTWADKQQIKLLHRTDPYEWTVEKLSEGFPALPKHIQLIISSNWTKTKSHKIANHDKAVQTNWNQFKEGKLNENLPKELIEHLKKFTNRSLNFQQLEMEQTQPEPIKNKSGEFYQIISKYQQLKTKQTSGNDHLMIESKESKPKIEENYIDETMLQSRAGGKQVTLNELRNQVRIKARSEENLNEDDKLMVSRKSTEADEAQVVPIENFNEIMDLTQKKYETAIAKAEKKTIRDYSHLVYPEQISIPKKYYKRGKTYKLNDCYYDDNGEFLYRVPGMT